VRETTIAGADLREIITLENESKVTFLKPLSYLVIASLGLGGLAWWRR